MSYVCQVMKLEDTVMINNYFIISKVSHSWLSESSSDHNMLELVNVVKSKY